MKKNLSAFLVLFLLIVSCKSKSYFTEAIEGEQLPITKETEEDENIKDYLSPFRYHLNKYLDKELSHNTTTMVKDIKTLEDGEMNMPIGNFFADAIYEQADGYFFNKKKRHIDFSLFNWGGIRSELAEGSITTRMVYQLMPFENQLVVAEVTGAQLYDMAKYLFDSKLPHPISNQVQLTMNTRGEVVSFLVNKKTVLRKKRYYVCTFDYLYNGGDRMNFFKNSLNVTNISYNAREALIDYLRKTDHIDFKSDGRFRIK
jgi:secreted or periplasmic 5'-nucleotidase